MKSYLSLIPISARVRKKQSRMIILCIVLAVFLVTTIFSLAEAGIKMETNSSVDKGGYWHIFLEGIPESDAQEIGGRADVAASSWYDVLNLDDDLKMDKDYYIEGAQTALCGIEDQFIGDIMHFFSEGSHVGNGSEVILTENAKELLGVETGDTITLNTPAGDYDFVITGFRISGNGKYVGSNGGVTAALLVKDDQVGAFMNIDTFREICAENGETGHPRYYIQFQKRTNLKKAMEEIKAQYGLADGDIGLNTILMAANGISNKEYIKNIYPLAGVLFILILMAGVLMISGSMNSNVAKRLQFFGMLRCIGASRSQIIHFVRIEALYWCKSAVPTGVAVGVVFTWIICAGLKYIVGGECADMPVFTVSIVGILCGVTVGVVTVFLAAQAPAKRAAKVSPVAAVSGNAGEVKNIKRAMNDGFSKVETALGIHHAVSARKNLLLMTGSFALSIILFLCFSVLIELIGCLLPQKASSPDLDITSMDMSNDIDEAVVQEIAQIDGVAHVLPRSVCRDVPAVYQGKSSSVEQETVTNVELISYNDYQLELLIKDDDLRKGSDLTTVYGDGDGVLVIWDRDIPWEIGDKLCIAGEELEIAGMLKYNPFTNDGSSGGVIDIVASQETFTRLT
ncbi:MAG: ABC transporter permease, partial [Lachnospiraceae bacterium]|nr:ABC transporter permease [Lachnospiraceae bacterium]